MDEEGRAGFAAHCVESQESSRRWRGEAGRGGGVISLLYLEGGGGSETRAGTSSNTWMELCSGIKSSRLGGGGGGSSLRLCLGCHGNRAL